jgi:twitching motility protein PilT
MPAPNKEDILFGKVAIKNKLATADQVRECLGILEKTDRSANGNSLGRLLLQKGYLQPNQYQAITQHVRGAAAADAAGPDPLADPPRAPRAAAGAAKDSFRVADVARMDFQRLVDKPIDAYLKTARELGASDLHFQVDAPPFIKLHGQIIYLKHPVMTPEYTRPRILEILGDFERSMLEKHLDVDFCFEAEHGRYRSNVLRQRKGLDAVFRVIPDHVPTLGELHLPESLQKFCTYRQGLVLITGPSGCGKSATMAALIDIINEAQHDHIVTVEEPIEYIIESKNCNVNQRHVRVHTESYATALRSAMRADPDYICVGEMRDLETISMAITAAETGHLVFGTLHTTNAMRSVDRIIDVFSPREQEQIRAMVSESLRGVISQQLIPRADGSGREPALEVLFATPAVANLIREKKTFQLTSVLQTGAKQGMVIMDDSIAQLLRQNLITRESAIFYAENSARFKSNA